MCGRFASKTPTKDLLTLLDAVEPQTPVAMPEADFNVAPTKQVRAALLHDGRRELRPLRWGLMPWWSKDLRAGARMINARVETVATKPAYRSAFKSRRCLIPADGYYEWQPIEGRKQPYFLRPADDSLLMMAGLYEVWHDAEKQPWWTCTIITTDAPDDLGHIHDRTPMAVSADQWSAWLDPDTSSPLELVRPAVAGAITATAVSSLVNSVKNNGPELLEPL